jgi:hypothetical protein
MPDLGRLQKLVEDTITSFDEPGKTTAALLRTCIRIATLRNDFANLLWLQLEAYDGNTPNPEQAKQRRLALLAHMDKEEAERIYFELTEAWIRRRSIPNEKDKMRPGSVDSLEELVTMLQQQTSGLIMPEGLHPIDAYHRSADIAQAKMTIATAINELRVILSRIRSALYDFLVTTERQLDYGSVNADIFERMRAFVDEQLAAITPEALEQFQAAYRRVNEGDTESLSHALTSCRRILKNVADAVYPPVDTPVVGADGRTRNLTDAAYRNRLLQFVSEAIGKHGPAGVVVATIQDLASRLEALDALASKGVHATVTAAEVDTCVIQTYLMVGDVLRLRAGRSALPDALAEGPSVVARS